ncbi:MAG: esterase-like activity of phytase family protein [Hyphomonadaceae bacterium]|nr:esterase-like activity of phytase family protein [Hyphomonadaceae bacterium]
MSGMHGPGRLTRRRLLGGLAAGAGVGWATYSYVAAEEDAPSGALAAPHAIAIEARPIAHFLRSSPQTQRFGDLEFRGGLILASPASHFGGWSGLVMDADGRSLFSISDMGAWLSADVAYEGNRPARLTGARIGPLLGIGGRPLRSKREQDAEAVTLLDGTLTRGTLLIGFERMHRIGRFEIRNRELRAPSGYLTLPREAQRMQPNQGIEALAVLQAGPLRGSVVAFAERFTRGSGYHTGWLWVKGEPQRVQLKDIDGFNITDAAGLPDGGLLVLERYFRWTQGVKMRIRRLAAKEIVPGARMTGQTLLEADSSYEIDNMEGIAVHRGARGETVVSLISDDNFNSFLQRTVFLQFTLLGE